MTTHVLKQAKTAKELGSWYDAKYTEMGDGWECPIESAIEYLEFAGIAKDTSKVLLDVGCGAGHFIETAQNYAECIGIDLSKVAIKKAKTRCPNVRFFVSDIENLEATTMKFDYITSIGSIEHCISITKALKNIKRLLKDGGLFYALVPNEEWQHFDQVNETTFTDEEWVDLFKKNGFSVKKQLRLGDITHFVLI